MSHPVKTQTNSVDDPLLTLYVTIDDLLEQAPLKKLSGPGRPTQLTPAELITGVVYAVGMVGIQDWQRCWNFLKHSHQREFPDLPEYPAFIAHLHRVFPLLLWVLQRLMIPTDQSAGQETIRLLDATKLPVCTNIRIGTHRVAKGLAQRGKTSQGWFYGFKLHLAVTPRGQLRSVWFTPGNVHDRQALDRLTLGFQGMAVGDAGYLVKESIHQRLHGQGVWLLTGVRRNMGRLITHWQHQLLKVRQRVEDVFGVLKERLNLVTSVPRSVMGYFLHYVVVLLAYQVHQVYGII